MAFLITWWKIFAHFTCNGHQAPPPPHITNRVYAHDSTCIAWMNAIYNMHALLCECVWHNWSIVQLPYCVVDRVHLSDWSIKVWHFLLLATGSLTILMTFTQGDLLDQGSNQDFLKLRGVSDMYQVVMLYMYSYNDVNFSNGNCCTPSCM